MRVFFAALLAVVPITTLFAQGRDEAVPVNPQREAFFGDLHLHTSYSLDAYLMGTTSVDPDVAYRFAKGEAVYYFGERIRRREPLDFMAVTDHAELIGMLDSLSDARSQLSQSQFGREIREFLALPPAPDGRRGIEGSVAKELPASAQRLLLDWLPGKTAADEATNQQVRTAWQREIEFANRHYSPGRFTTFIAYEWTAHGKDWAVLHRNVIFRGNAAPFPFTARDSQNPEDLWAWLEKVRAQGYEAIAIPHSANLSNGLMYDWVDSGGRPIDEAYAEMRQANEPLSEISQTKGSSETHPLLSPSDEFANYEIMERVAGTPAYRPGGSYLRDALGRGLVMEHKLGVNPFKYGFVGGSDLHSGLSVSAQGDFNGGHTGTNLGGNRPDRDQAAHILADPGAKRDEGVARMHTSGNLTGVWAESNTRESIYNALRRRETFATTGTRLKLRFFGGWTLDKNLITKTGWVRTAYSEAVPMGGDLRERAGHISTPTFAVWAVKDPNSANLDRAQVIKVSESNGRYAEKVYDVAWAGHRRRDRAGKIPAIGDTVDLKTGRYSNEIGASELKTVWKDPDFHPGEAAAYYLRVLEIPTPRWTTLLAVQHNLPLPKDVPATIQERGWSSPIWYAPAAAHSPQLR